MSLVDWREQQSLAEAMAKAALTDADEAKALAQSADKTLKAAAMVFEKFGSITKTGLLVSSPSPLTATFLVPDAKTGDLIFVHRAGRPTTGPSGVYVAIGGVSLESTGYVPSDGVVEVYYFIPTLTLALGSVLTIPIRLRGFRAT